MGADGQGTDLHEGEKDLITILVSSGINCTTCYKNKNAKGWDDGGFMCDEVFCTCPEINLCFKWRQRQEDNNEDNTERGE